MNNSRNK